MGRLRYYGDMCQQQQQAALMDFNGVNRQKKDATDDDP